MIVECTALRPRADVAMKLRPFYDRGASDFDLELGRRYTVLGLTFSHGSPWIDIPSEGGWPQTVPLALFRVVDRRASKYWEMQQASDGAVALLPASMHAPDFASRVADDEPEAVAEYQRLVSLLEAEAAETPV